MPYQTILPYDVNQRNADKQTASSISDALEGLVQRQLQKVQQGKNAQGYEQAWNLPPDQAKFIAGQSPEFQQEFIKALRAEQESREFDKRIHPEKYATQPQPATPLQPNQPPQPSLQDNMSALGGNNQQDAVMMSLLRGLQGGQPTNVPQQTLANVGQRNEPQSQAPQQPKSIADILANKPLNPNLQAKAEELNLKKESNEESKKTNRFKASKKEREEIYQRGEIAEKNIRALKQLKALNATGKLVQGQQRQALEAFGLEDFFTNDPTQVADKILGGLRTGISKAYGTSRITNLLTEAYDKTWPRMINTPTGMAAVLDNKILDEEGEALTRQALRNLEKKYQKSDLPYPLDIVEEARDTIRPQLDALGKKGIENIDKFFQRDNADIIKQLPPASESKGNPRIHAERGIVAESDGKKWNIRIATPEELAGEGAS